MTNYKQILGLDPSGSFTEGKGTTGWCVFNAPDNVISLAGVLEAHKHSTMESYWNRHLELIATYYKRYGAHMIVVMEDYILYSNKAADQINSRMETPKLIGVIQHYCWQHNIPYYMQFASEVKNRWTNEILQHKKYIAIKGKSFILPQQANEILSRHSLDAIRHAVHFNTFRNGR